MPNSLACVVLYRKKFCFFVGLEKKTGFMTITTHGGVQLLLMLDDRQIRIDCSPVLSVFSTASMSGWSAFVVCFPGLCSLIRMNEGLFINDHGFTVRFYSSTSRSVAGARLFGLEKISSGHNFRPYRMKLFYIHWTTDWAR